jgi:hypothetical protein
MHLGVQVPIHLPLSICFAQPSFQASLPMLRSGVIKIIFNIQKPALCMIVVEPFSRFNHQVGKSSGNTALKWTETSPSCCHIKLPETMKIGR